jgi:PAS domain S-box-containing protein
MDANTHITKRSAGAGGCFSVIAGLAREAIAVLDTSGVVRYANAAWAAMHGYDRPDEVTGLKITSFHNKEQLSADVLPLLLEVGRHGQISGPVGHMRKNQTVVPTNTTMTALKDKTGKILAVVVYATDTTETDKLNAELSAINKQVGQYASQAEQTQKQIQALKAALTEKEKEVAVLMSRLEWQNEEKTRREKQWQTLCGSLTDTIEKLQQKVLEMKHREVEFLDGIDEYEEPAGANGGLDPEQLKQISVMARKFIDE